MQSVWNRMLLYKKTSIFWFLLVDIYIYIKLGNFSVVSYICSDIRGVEDIGYGENHIQFLVHDFKYTSDLTGNIFLLEEDISCVSEEFTRGRYYIIKAKWGAKVTLACIYLLTRNLLYVMGHWINWSDLNITIGEKNSVFTILIWTEGLHFTALKSSRNTITKVLCIFLKFCFERGDSYTAGYNLSPNPWAIHLNCIKFIACNYFS